MRDLYFLNYNNYYNRQVKILNTLSEYSQYLAADVVRRINFIPNDGITTTVIINANSFNLYNSMPDYLLVVNEYADIESRWFVIDATRTTNNQYRFSLKRDTLADYNEEVLDAVSMVYKGNIDTNNVAIYNSEQVNFNQIKQSETLLKDYTGMPWLVAYMPTDITEDFEGHIQGYYDEEYDNLSDYQYYQYNNNKFAYFDNISILFPLDLLTKVSNYNTYKAISNSIILNNKSVADGIISVEDAGYRTTTVTNTYPIIPNKSTTYISLNTLLKLIPDETMLSVKDEVSDNVTIFKSQAASNNLIYRLNQEDGKVIKVGNKLYRVNLIANNTQILDILSLNSQLANALIEQIKKVSIYKDFNEQDLKIVATISWTFELVEIENNDVKFKFNFKDSSENLIDITNTDSPYGILCMPYADDIITKTINGNLTGLQLSKENRVKIMQSMAIANGRCYDIQILPYCPISNLEINSNVIKLPADSNYREIEVSSVVNEGSGEYITSLFIANSSRLTFNIISPVTVDNIKIQNDTDLWRLCSPNYNGVFEFNACKLYEGNNQVIDYFNVDITFKPYTPYIHINPNFKGLYGKDFDDARGLICSGDFSIDIISDNWDTYHLQNKNYQLQFDRQIESMELNKNLSLTSGIVNTMAGGISGTAAGALIGGGVGAGFMGIASMIEGAYNTWENQRLITDQIDAAKDQHFYQLDNIKAQPNALTKVSTLNNNNKLFPFLEHYSCSDDEKELFENKLKYEGMTVNRIGKIRDYLIKEENFISAKVIRITLNSSTSVINDINNELAKGVFMYGN